MNASPSRLILALDVSTIQEADALVQRLAGPIGIFKIGYWLMFDAGFHDLVRTVKAHQCQLFLDAKLNDIPATVEHGVAAAARLGADFITVHSDAAMLDAAMQGKGNSTIKVMAVTALTSLDASGSQDRFYAGLLNAQIAGCDGLIMSPADLTRPMGNGDTVRAATKGMLIATPGVRLAGSSLNDHKRSGSPEQAIADGADYLVIGRPIIAAADPETAAHEFLARIG